MNYCYQIPKSVLDPVERIIVIGDIHGDWRALKTSLKLAGLIKNKHWIGGKTHLVQIGDIFDRGGRPSSVTDEQSEHKILKFLFGLQQEAKRAGGAVHLLLGNHELMNVMGNFRYVSPMGLSDFGGNRKAALRPGGPVAKKLACNSQSILKIGNWLFSHAGVLPNISGRYGIEEANKKIREFLLGNTHLSRDSELIDLFWHRNYSSTPAKCGLLNKTLLDYDSKYMAVGHTVQYEGINSTCNNALWRVDVGMSQAFGKAKTRRFQVLEILNDGRKINIL